MTYEGQIKFGIDKTLRGTHGKIISVTHVFFAIKSQSATDLMQRKDKKSLCCQQ